MTQKAPAKINAFLKITGKRGNYHEMVSRFIKIESLYDTLSFLPKDDLTPFVLEGDFGCALESNTIYKAFLALKASTRDPKIDDYFISHKVSVIKHIPSFAGLGGGSSDAATFLKMTNQAVGLNLSTAELAAIALEVGADVPFFIYDYQVANIEGIGEIVTPFEETDLPEFEIFTPKEIACDTVKVFQNFRAKYYKEISQAEKTKLLRRSTQEALDVFTLETSNDLFHSALDLYPKLAHYAKAPWYFSGSGSSFFRIKE